MEKALEKAKILMQALPYIKEYHGKNVVIKFGGKAMNDPVMEQSIANDLALMHFVGINPVVVHGGGPEISQAMKNAGLKPNFINGLRVTDKQTMDFVTTVSGTICNQIVENINKHGDFAAGFCGDLILAKEKDYPTLGFVGEVEKIKINELNKALEDGFIPIISAIGKDSTGEFYNINADTVAAAVAESLQAEKLIYLTDVDGIYSNHEDRSSLISILTLKESSELVKGKQIAGGMLPKLLSCIEALKTGVHRCHILNGTAQHALLLEIFTDEGIGTMIKN